MPNQLYKKPYTKQEHHNSLKSKGSHRQRSEFTIEFKNKIYKSDMLLSSVPDTSQYMLSERSLQTISNMTWFIEYWSETMRDSVFIIKYIPKQHNHLTPNEIYDLKLRS
jgi:hypothetical protein